MNPVSRGIRNAFRNLTRTFSIIIILGISIGLALTMLVAHQAVVNKITSVKESVGSTITVAPAGFSGFSSVNNSLTTSQLEPLTKLAHVESVDESFTASLTNENSTSTSSFPGANSNSSDAKTSLSSPSKLNTSRGSHFFFQGGGSSSTSTSTFTLPVSLLATNDTSSIDSTSIKLTSGKLISNTADNNEALISQKMATKNDLKVGSTFTAYSKTLTVAGIFTGSTQNASNTVVVSLITGQTISGETGDVTSATVNVDSLDDLASVTTQVKDMIGSKADVTSSIETADNTVAPLNSVKSVSLYSLFGAMIAAAVIILLTMVMIVRERTREIGVTKAIGASNSTISLQFMSEALTLTLLSAVVAMVLSTIAASPITHALVSNSSSSSTTMAGGAFSGGFAGRAAGSGAPSGGGFGGTGQFRTGGHGIGGSLKDNFSNIHAAVGWGTLGFGLLGALAIALLGSAVVSYYIAKIRPAEVMRTE
jgi:putative ABC transport system permease protein